MTSKPLAVNGFSKIAGGQLNTDIIVNGIAKIPEDLTCESVTVNGILRAKANLHILGSMRCNGLTKIKGHLQVEEDVKNSGTIKIAQQFYSNGQLNIGGTFKCGGDTSAIQGITCDGVLKSEGTLHSQGDIKISGRVKLQSNVIAKNFSIQSSDPAKFLHITSKIEGDVAVHDYLDLENTILEGNVQARTIKLGENCIVNGPIYYVNTIDIHPSVALNTKPQKIKEKDFLH